MTPARMAMSASASSSRIGRIHSGGCTPLRRGSMNGPSTCTPSAPGTRTCALRAAVSAAASTSGASVTTVGRKPVTPSRRCAAAIRGDRLDRRLGVEQHAAAAIDLPVDEAGGEHAAAEIDLLAAARAVLEVDERLDRAALDHERMIVEKPLAVEQARAVKDLHCAASLCGCDDAARQQDRSVGRIVERARQQRARYPARDRGAGLRRRRRPARPARAPSATTRRASAPIPRAAAARRSRARPDRLPRHVRTPSARRRRSRRAWPCAPSAALRRSRRRIRARISVGQRARRRKAVVGAGRRAQRRQARYGSPSRRRRARSRVRR